jgi:hypothetical protein
MSSAMKGLEWYPFIWGGEKQLGFGILLGNSLDREKLKKPS